MGIGYNTDAFKSRTGIFDWALGRQEESWTCSDNGSHGHPLTLDDIVFSRCWRRCFVGMSLRGLQWTIPGHFGLVLLGYDPALLFVGACMGAFYDFGWVRCFPDFPFGSPPPPTPSTLSLSPSPTRKL